MRGREALHRRFGWSVIATSASFLGSAVTSVAVSRLVNPSEYGDASVVLSTWGFLVVPISWCSAVTVRFGPVELERSGTISRTLGTRLLFAAPALGILAVLIPLVIAPCAGWSGTLTALTYAFLVASLAQDLAHGGAVSAQGFRALAASSLVTRALPAMMILASAVVPFSVRAEHLLGATVTGTALGAALLLYQLHPVARIGRPDRELLRAMWRYIAPALVGIPALSFVMWVDPIVLSRFVPRAEVGHYQLAYLVMTMSSMAATSLTAVFEPELVRATARGDADALAGYVRLQQPRMVQMFGLASFALACVAEPVVLLVVGPQFGPSGRIAAVLCVAAAFQMATSTLATVITTTDAQAAGHASKVILAAVNVGGDVLLGARWGAIGVALANVAAWLVGGVLLSVLLRRRAPVRLGSWALLAGLAPFVLLFVTSSPPLWSRVVAGAALALSAVTIAAQLLGRGRRPDLAADA